jgi:hypothetical protein
MQPAVFRADLFLPGSTRKKGAADLEQAQAG